MKVIYLAILDDLDAYIGVLKKIKSQTLGLKNNGVSICTYIFYSKGTPDESNDIISYKYVKAPVKRLPFTGMILGHLHKRLIFNQITKLMHGKDFDKVYFRYPFSDYLSYKFIKENKSRVVFEHNTKELEEFNLTLGRGFAKIFTIREKFFARLSFAHLSGTVGCSVDFVEHQQEKVKYGLRNTITISNGIDVESIPIRSIPSFNGKDINILFAANISDWHGFDRLLNGFKMYVGETNFKFYLLGNKNLFENEISKLKFVPGKLKAFQLDGFINGSLMNKYFNSCHVAIGSLGLHRLGIINGVPLKHREYIARGIPFVYSGNDQDLPAGNNIEPYLMKITPDESLLDFNEIDEFVNRVYSFMDFNLKMREFAIENIDWNIKMKQLKFFLENI